MVRRDVRVRMTVRYRNYKRFGSTVRIGPSTANRGRRPRRRRRRPMKQFC